MREYPRRIFKSELESKLVFNQEEERQGAKEGYESSWKSETIEKRKGTDKEILRFSEPSVTNIPEFTKKTRKKK